MYSEITRSIKVTVKPFYLEDESSPSENHYVWAYQVRIENQGGETVQLRRRHWRITDGIGRQQEVRGPGVGANTGSLPTTPGPRTSCWRPNPSGIRPWRRRSGNASPPLFSMGT